MTRERVRASASFGGRFSRGSSNYDGIAHRHASLLEEIELRWITLDILKSRATNTLLLWEILKTSRWLLLFGSD